MADLKEHPGQRPMSERHLTLAEVAEQFQFSPRWLRDFIRARGIPVLRSGRTITFDDRALRALERVLRRHPENASEAYLEALRLTEGPALPNTGYVYFAQAGADGPIKIGKANDVEGRLRTLQTSQAEPLTLLGTMPGGLRRERDIQTAFARYRLKGEWFSPASDLLAFIRLNTDD